MFLEESEDLINKTRVNIDKSEIENNNGYYYTKKMIENNYYATEKAYKMIISKNKSPENKAEIHKSFVKTYKIANAYYESKDYAKCLNYMKSSTSSLAVKYLEMALENIPGVKIVKTIVPKALLNNIKNVSAKEDLSKYYAQKFLNLLKNCVRSTSEKHNLDDIR